ncbi:hypothetical protein C0058_15810 [Pseudomonas sp. NC02]|nr:hypothetical protein C0058_15810 [Pseudomonas sp. NC02]
MCERACSRKRWISHCRCRLSHRLREQARSHIWIGFTTGLGFTAWRSTLQSTSQRQSLHCPPSIPGHAPSVW